MEANTAISTTTAKPKAKIRGNKKPEKEKDPKGKSTKGKGKEVVLNYGKFEGQGLNYKCKLFGFVEVPGARGDRSSVQAIHKLKQQAKQLKRGTNEHKLKIIFNITLKGVRVINEKTQTIEHEHPIHKISFISHDPEDRHIFGYIYSPPRTTEGARKYYLFAIKAEKSADVITCQLYELFQVVFKMQENKKIKTRDDPTVNQRQSDKYSLPLEPLQDKMLLEMSNKLGGDQQYSTEEHLYAEPTFVKSSPSVSPKPHYAVPSNIPATRVSNDSESRENEIEHGRNGVSEVKSETLPSSSPFTQDPFSGNGNEENLKDPDKEASAFSQVSSDNTLTSTGNEDSGFEPDIDSGTSSLSTEPKTDDPFQFHAEFPPFENGFSGSVNAPENSNDFEETVISDKHSTSSDQFQFDVFNSSTLFDASSDKNQHFEEPHEKNHVEATSLSTSSVKSDEVENIEKVNENEVGSVTKSPSLLEKVHCDEFSSDELTATKPTDMDKKESSDEKLTSNVTAVSFENVDQEVDETERNSENKNDTSVSTNLFEVKFETENEENITGEKSEKNVFSSFTAEDFPNQDPFSDGSAAAKLDDKSSFDTFPLDDPFSPRGGTNKERLTDPFADNDNIFSCDFNTSSDKNNEDVFGEDEDKRSDLFSQANPNENNREEDIFEAIFEAKMEEGIESEEINEQQDESKVVTDLLSSKENNVDMNVQVDLDNKKLESNEEEETSATPANDSKIDKDITEDYPQVLILDVSEEVENTIAQEVEAGGNDQEECSEINIFDMSTSDDYVTLKTAVQATSRPLSPSEFTPPPLPPRPTLHIHIEPSSSSGIPKQPPALPPRPSNQSLDSELRKPPELPPRVDLEEKNSNIESFSDNIENVESTPNNNTSPLFQTNFDSFDFSNLESNTNIELEGSKVVAFDAGDPFKDPFVGSDPFQTPVPADPFQTPGSADPFSSSTSFDRDYKQDSEGFDPFSGDDPFAATNFSNSSFQTRLSINEAEDDKSSDKFTDFSGFSTPFN